MSDRLLQDHRPASAAGSTVNTYRHAVKMSQCPCGLGKCAFDYEMCLPFAHYKSSDTGFCLSRALPVPALSQPPRLLFKVTSSSLWPAAIPDWSRLELSWRFKDFHNSFGNGHSSNISSANCVLPKGWKMDMGRWVPRAAHERRNEPSDRMYYLREVVKEKAAENQFTQWLALECTHLLWLTLILFKLDPSRLSKYQRYLESQCSYCATRDKQTL